MLFSRKFGKSASEWSVISVWSMAKPSQLCAVIAVLCVGLLWSYLRKEAPRSGLVETRPYHHLTELELGHIDRIYGEEYDARRFGVSLLKSLKEERDKVPFNWEDVLNYKNKTELGLYWLYQYPVRQVVLMNEQLQYVDTTTADDGRLELVTEIESIKKEIQHYFQDEEPWCDDFKAIELNTKDFDLSFEQNLPTLPTEQQRYLTDEIEEYRYFKEGYLLNRPGLAHYEVRFYQERLRVMDRVAILHRIVRAWARFTTRASINTWLAHGTLMGYYFNGLIMPWDNDLDVQVTAESFWRLVRLNGTLVVDYQDDVNLGKYLIDVNPWFFKRDRNPENKIDARFIDVESGLYIDITVLTSEINPTDIQELLEQKQNIELKKVFNPYYESIHTETESLNTELARQINETWDKRDLVSCKDYHFFKVSELSPLIPTIYEGEILMVPNNIQKMLLREYGRKSLYLLEFRTWTYNKLERLWTHKRAKYEVNPTLREFTSLHSTIKNTTFKRHVFNTALLRRFPSFRVDPGVRDFTIGTIY